MLVHGQQKKTTSMPRHITLEVKMGQVDLRQAGGKSSMAYFKSVVVDSKAPVGLDLTSDFWHFRYAEVWRSNMSHLPLISKWRVVYLSKSPETERNLFLKTPAIVDAK